MKHKFPRFSAPKVPPGPRPIIKGDDVGYATRGITDLTVMGGSALIGAGMIGVIGSAFKK